MIVKESKKWFVPWGAIVGFLANLWVFLFLVLPLLTLPRGGDYRLMAQVGAAGIAAVIGVVVALPISIYDLRRSKVNGSCGIVLALLPFPLFDVCLHVIASVNGWTLAD